MFEIDQSTLPFVQTRQALLVLDLQNEFVSSEARIPVTQPPNLVGDILKLLPDFRSFGTVIWVRSKYEASRPVNGEGDGSEKVIIDEERVPVLNQAHAAGKSSRRISDTTEGPSGKNEAIRARMADFAQLMDSDSDEDREVWTDETFLTTPSGEKHRFVLPGTQASELSAEVLKSQDVGKDIIINKSYYSAFKDGTLVQILRARFVTEIYICGVLSNMSVYATAMDATQFGYAITLVDDCLGYRNQATHNETMRRLETSTGCDNITSADLLKSLKQKAKTVQQQAPAPAPRPTRREPSKSRGKKEKGPELDSMMSKLNIASSGPPVSANSRDIVPVNATSSLVTDVEGGGSFESPEVESQDIQLPLVSSRSTGEGADKSNRVPSKIKTRKRTPKMPSQDSESSPANSAASRNEKKIASKTNPSQPPTLESTNIPKKSLEVKAAKAASLPKSHSSAGSSTPTKSTSLAKQQPKTEHATSSSKSIVSPPVEKVDQSVSPEELPSICEGDTMIIHNLLKGDLAQGIFEKIRDEVRWQKMSHQGGDVPRLVAVQGRIGEDGSIPIYRHPADESPPLLPFSHTVSLIREQAEKHLGHPLNHVLIQFYRDGTDYISEHSDKTLDIVPKTFIVNVSLGAQRTMIFRTKKQQQTDKISKASEAPLPRQTLRAPMPHNSLCKVGLVTNMRWLHGIRQDKRLKSEKSNTELAYGGARISLTFRQIGTFLSKDQQKIWGQGAVSKSRDKANFVINGNTPEAQKMVRAFGHENHSSEFDWAVHYGAGFDVLHLNNSPKFFLSSDVVADVGVKLALQSFGIKWEEGKLSSSFKWKDGSLQPDAPEIPEKLPVKFVDNDLSKSTTVGDGAVLLYLNALYGPQLRPQVETARLFTRFRVAEELKRKAQSGGGPFDIATVRAELDLLETFANEGEFIAGSDASIADWMLLPVLETIYQGNKQAFGERLEALKTYYLRLRAKEEVVGELGPLQLEPGKEVEEPGSHTAAKAGDIIAVDEVISDEEEEGEEDGDDE